MKGARAYARNPLRPITRIADKGQGLGLGRDFSPAAASDDDQCVEGIIGESLGEQLRARRTGDRTRNLGDHPQSIGRPGRLASRRFEHSNWPSGIEKLEVREDQYAYRLHGCK